MAKKLTLAFFREKGRKGGQTTAERMTKEERHASAQKAARARWEKAKEGKA